MQLSEGIINSDVATSGELVTNLTITAERETEYYSGIQIDINITRMEAGLLTSGSKKSIEELERSVSILNHIAMIAANRIAAYKSALLNHVLSCNIFTTNYPLLIDHVLREAKSYLRMLRKLQNQEELNMAMEAAYQEKFWNRIMAEHAKFIRGLLDPTEEKLLDTANDFENGLTF